MIELAAIFIGAWLLIVLVYKIGKAVGRSEGFIAALALMPTEDERRVQAQRESAPWQ